MDQEYPKKRSIADWLVLAAGTGLFLGMIPPQTATLGLALGLPLAIGLYHAVGWLGYVPALVALWVIGIPICQRSATLLGQKDPRAVVYDEYSTLPLIFFLVPPDALGNWKILAIGYGLHRFFDITKILGARRFERLGGGLGIMADDIVASLYGFLTMRILYAGGWLT